MAAYQISPNPNLSTITVNDTFAENWLEPFNNYGHIVINVPGRLVNHGLINNYSNLINHGILDNYGKLISRNINLESSSILNNHGIITNFGWVIGAVDSVLNNYGTIDNQNTIGGAGSLYNYGVIDNDAYIDIFVSGLLVNNGTINHWGNFENRGTLENHGNWNNLGTRYMPNVGEIINTGTISNFYALTNYVKVDNSGTISEVFGDGINGHYKQFTGETINNGIIDVTTIEFQGGVLKGTGTLKGSVIIGTGATVIPGLSPGTLNIDGDLHSNGNYVFEIVGVNSGQYDVLDIDGNAFFTGGNFKFEFIDGYLPSAGDHWDFLVADSLNGSDTVGFTFAGLGDGLGIDLHNEGGKISLTVITAVPEPETYAMLLAGLGLMGFMAYRRKLKEAA